MSTRPPGIIAIYNIGPALEIATHAGRNERIPGTDGS